MEEDKQQIVKQHEAAKEYIVRLKEELAMAKDQMNTVLQVYYNLCFFHQMSLDRCL